MPNVSGNHNAYAESPVVNAIRDTLRLVVIGLLVWSANTLNNVDKDTNLLNYRMSELEKKVISNTSSIKDLNQPRYSDDKEHKK
jgi:hypothetical protein